VAVVVVVDVHVLVLALGVLLATSRMASLHVLLVAFLVRGLLHAGAFVGLGLTLRFVAHHGAFLFIRLALRCRDAFKAYSLALRPAAGLQCPVGSGREKPSAGPQTL